VTVTNDSTFKLPTPTYRPSVVQNTFETFVVGGADGLALANPIAAVQEFGSSVWASDTALSPGAYGAAVGYSVAADAYFEASGRDLATSGDPLSTEANKYTF
jgi:hypothetical protein